MVRVTVRVQLGWSRVMTVLTLLLFVCACVCVCVCVYVCVSFAVPLKVRNN